MAEVRLPERVQGSKLSDRELRKPIVLLLGAWMGFGDPGVYMGQIVDWGVRSLCFGIRCRGTRWQYAAVR